MSELDKLLKEFGFEEEEEKKEEKPKTKPLEKPLEKHDEELVEEKQILTTTSQPVEQIVQPSLEVKLPIDEEIGPPPKTVWLIFGDKGSGKTTVSMSFPGNILVLSFDRKSAIIKFNMYNNDPRIKVFDVVKLMDYSTSQAMLESAEKTFEAIIQLLDVYPKAYGSPDWVVIDGAQIMQQICEWTMRKRHNIGPFDGIANLNLWKERRAYMRDIHNRALNIAKKGVIYTTYVEKDEVIIAGETVHKKDVPAWVDVLIYETDYVLQTMYNPVTKSFEVKVTTSKNDKLLPSGAVYNVTGKKFWDVVGKLP